MDLGLRVLPGEMAVCRLDPDEPVPEWASPDRAPINISRTDAELSIICEARRVPEGVTAERGWRAIEVEGPLDLNKIGIVAGLSAPLARAGIPILSVATYLTDYLLVPARRIGEALELLRDAGARVADGG